MIIVELACNRSITTEYNETRLLFFFGRAWENGRIRQWLVSKDTEKLKENNLIKLINYLYEKGNVFECNRSTIANLLIRMDVLNDISKYKTIMNNFSKTMPKVIQREAHSIFLEICK